jgi:hypothetical protein
MLPPCHCEARSAEAISCLTVRRLVMQVLAPGVPSILLLPSPLPND